MRVEVSLPTLCIALRDAGASDGFSAFQDALRSGRFVERQTGPGTALYSLDVNDSRYTEEQAIEELFKENQRLLKRATEAVTKYAAPMVIIQDAKR